jgi:pimeloyl-ACP methyl ester carboxylesterase
MATRPVQSASHAWRDHYWWSNDGVRLHARVYDPPTDTGALPLLCLPGLTRNARDFDRLAPHLAQARRVYAIDLRGRGDSGYAKDALSYVPLTYVQDVVALLTGEGVERFICVGTSLGGLVTMLLGATQPGRLAAAVLNDIGPDIDPRGLARIRCYVGQIGNFPTWVHAARSIAAANADAYPDWTLEDWLAMVKRTHRLTREGRIVADYDSNIAQPFKVPGGEAGVDLWPAFDALKSVPTLILRGVLSDILAPDTAQQMVSRLAQARLVTVPMVGHAPTLDEPEAVGAIDALLSRL